MIQVGYTGTALADRSLAPSVPHHKAMFFREKAAGGQWIDYGASVSGELRVVPDGFARNALEEDYKRMLSDGMLLDGAEPFELLIERCADLEARANDT